MNSRKLLFLSLTVSVAAAAGLTGLGFGAGEAPPATTPELVATYSDLATAILATKRAETNIVKSICADAYHAANRSLSAAKAASASGDGAVAGDHLERAATLVGMIATEGDKAVAGVRNRLLEGGHHHHATAEIAKKYDPGYVLIKKTDKTVLLALAGELGKLAGAAKTGEAGAAGIEAATMKLADAYRTATK